MNFFREMIQYFFHVIECDVRRTTHWGVSYSFTKTTTIKKEIYNKLANANKNTCKQYKRVKRTDHLKTKKISTKFCATNFLYGAEQTDIYRFNLNFATELLTVYSHCALQQVHYKHRNAQGYKAKIKKY